MADTFQPSSLVYTPPRRPSQNLRTLLAYIDSRNHLSPDIMKYFHATLEHRYLPKSLGRPVLNRRQYGEYMSQLQPMFRSFRMTLHQVIETGDTIVYHATAVGESVSGARYDNEYMTTMQFVMGEHGPQISYVKEYVDSRKTTEFFQEHSARVAEINRRRSQSVSQGS